MSRRPKIFVLPNSNTSKSKITLASAGTQKSTCAWVHYDAGMFGCTKLPVVLNMILIKWSNPVIFVQIVD